MGHCGTHQALIEEWGRARALQRLGQTVQSARACQLRAVTSLGLHLTGYRIAATQVLRLQLNTGAGRRIPASARERAARATAVHRDRPHATEIRRKDIDKKAAYIAGTWLNNTCFRSRQRKLTRELLGMQASG